MASWYFVIVGSKDSPLYELEIPAKGKASETFGKVRRLYKKEAHHFLSCDLF